MFDRVFAAVLLDMDGTLVSSTEAVERSWTRWATEHDVPVPDFATVHGVTADDLVARLLAGRPATERAAARRRIDEIELAEPGPVVVLPGAREVLETLVSARRCAIVTSAGRALATMRLGGAGLPVPPMVTADDVSRGKPAPDPYLAGAALLGVEPADCLVIEDAPAGLSAARAAGAVTLGLRTTTPEPEADRVIGDLSAVVVEADERGVRVSAR
ncbi:HAD-IA family hydrolase [Actinotalea sp. M2MS4P-6]|uniref:HAD-IA family hydrolase n=1 Tax=Actinotalea sp. M2MS4P-6 TaxID=2983762 RepID=UPI0021E36292|nr:HAD-IA family hydrolase [Actinotalea sp. M2MS4P-6]MCV2394957.1 HAD-IA family hydrolase [Actinotalea sp. M2MS4P-6]